MKNPLHRFRLVWIVLFLTGSAAVVAAAERTIRVMTIGNSFAENALKFLPQIGESQGVEFVVGRANLGGCSLERHARHLAAAQADPASEEGNPYPAGQGLPGESLLKMLERESWDFVTLQQASFHSFDEGSFEPFAGNLVAAIRAGAPGAEILVHQIWAYRADDPWFTGEQEQDGRGAERPTSQAEMVRRLRANYDALAARYGLRQLPVGDAFQQARGRKPWVFWWPDPQFDYADPEPETLPEQAGSLNVGWFWRTDAKTGERRLQIDGHHANLAGCYLAGLVWFELLTGQAPAADVWHPAELDDRQTLVLMRAAHAAVKARRGAR